MPRLADHDKRREEVAEAVWTIIGRVGVEKATLREIAREANCSTGMLSHYFRDKDELVRFAFGLAVDRAMRRIRERAGNKSGLEVLRDVGSEGLPLDEQRRLEGWVWLNFCGRAAASAALAAEHRRRYGEARAAVENVIRSAQSAGDLGADVSTQDETDMLIAFVDGLCAQALLDPPRFPPDRQIELLETFLSRLGRPPSPGSAAFTSRRRGGS